jgi:hypothetical protein
MLKIIFVMSVFNHVFSMHYSCFLEYSSSHYYKLRVDIIYD